MTRAVALLAGALALGWAAPALGETDKKDAWFADKAQRRRAVDVPAEGIRGAAAAERSSSGR